MSTKSKQGKKLVLIPDSVVSDLMRISNKQGKKFYDFMTEILQQILRTYEGGKNPQEVIDSYQLMEVHKLSGDVMMPKEVFDRILAKLYPKQKNFFKKEWYEWGQFVAQYLGVKFEDPVQGLVQLLRKNRWELNEVALNKEKDSVKIRCVSSLLSQEKTELLTEFIQGNMHALGYNTQNMDQSKGIILLEYTEDKK
ncbi:MAG: hypothetical protein ACOC6G_03415 [Thermoproteota archaeon]